MALLNSSLSGRRAAARLLALLVLGLSSLPALAVELTEAERLERCQNNKARLDELKRQAGAIALMTPFEVKRIAEDVIALGEVATHEGVSIQDMALIRQLAVRYKFSLINCLTLSQEQCGIDLLDAIQKAERQNAAQMAARKRLEDEAHNHEVNLIALSCVAPTIEIAGTWNSNWGTMTLDGVGTIEGTYDYQGGRIAGRMDGYTLVGKWSQTTSGKKCKHPELGSFYWGQVRLTFDAGGKSFSGDWSYCEEAAGGGGWSGSR